jgi:hypothetical protein
MEGQNSREVDWDYEIDLLARELAEKHPDLFFRTDSSFFFGAMRKVAAEAPGKSHFYLAVKLQQVVAQMGDAHTLINYHFHIDKSLILPLEAYWFEEGIYITQVDRLYEDALGKKLTAINGNPLSAVIDSFSTLLVNDNKSVIKYQIPRMLGWTQLLAHFGFSDTESVSLHLEDQEGKQEEIHMSLPVSLGDNIRLKPESMPLGWQDQKAYFRHQYLAEDKIFYIQYNKCWSREVEEEYGSGATALFMPSFKEFEKEVFQILKKQAVDKIVFDLRYNNGGHPQQGKDFIEKLQKVKIKGPGKFFLLVGRKTSSEALINAVDYLKYPGAVSVGEETGGKPNHFGQVRRFVLPESGLIVSHSTIYFPLLEEDPGSLVPDVKARVSMELYMKGLDPAYEAVRLYLQH